MKKLFAACFIAFCMVQVLPAETAWAQRVSGRVFLDKNGNGKLDRGEPGIAKVPVTDGVQFVLSDAKGRYRIEVAADPVLKEGGAAIISISRPSNYRPTTPWFRRVDEMAKQGGADFGLKREKQSLPFIFIHGTDTHMPRWPGKFAKFRTDIQKDVKFCIITGDLVNNADGGGFEEVKGQFDSFRKGTRDFPVPLYFVPGNHDVAGVRARWEDQQKKNPLYAYGFYTRDVGPLRWSFNYGGIHFVGLDFNNLQNGKWQWGIPPVAARWLGEDLKLLAPGTRIFLFVHNPSGGSAFRQAVKAHKIRGIFSGHTHGAPADNLNVVPARFWGGDLNLGYRLVQVSGEGFDTFYRTWANPYSITMDSPPGNTLKAGENIIRGAFYDPEKTIKKLTITIGAGEQQIPFQRGLLRCRFEAKFAVPENTKSPLTLTVSVTDGKETWQYKRKYKLAPKAAGK